MGLFVIWEVFLAYGYIEILGEVQVLPSGNMHWIAGCWLDKASRDAGDAPALRSDFSNANVFVGREVKRKVTRVIGEVVQYQLADLTWMDASEYNLYPIVTRDRSGAPVSGVPAPELNYEVESVIGGSWVRDDMEAQMRQWLVKQTGRTGDKSDPSLVFGDRHKTAQPPSEVIAMDKGIDENQRADVPVRGRL